MKSVMIDGVNYAPESSPQKGLREEEHRLLRELYSALWIEAYYDCRNDSTRDFAMQHIGKINRLNELMGFKQ